MLPAILIELNGSTKFCNILLSLYIYTLVEFIHWKILFFQQITESLNLYLLLLLDYSVLFYF